MRDGVVEILISTTFRIHRDIGFFFDQKPERNFFWRAVFLHLHQPCQQEYRTDKCATIRSIEYSKVVTNIDEIHVRMMIKIAWIPLSQILTG
jgi:hypothetical protein